MSLLISIFIIFAAQAFGQHVKLKQGLSPNKQYEIVLDADKGSRKWSEYEFKGASYPHFHLLDSKGTKIIRIEYQSDPHSDQQPLKKHITVSWNKSSNAFFINTRERFYSSYVLYFLTEKGFKEIEIPSYYELTGFQPTDTKFLRSRGFSGFEEWNSDSNLIYYLYMSPTADYKGKDPLRHRIELKLTGKGCKVVKRLPIEKR